MPGTKDKKSKKRAAEPEVADEAGAAQEATAVEAVEAIETSPRTSDEKKRKAVNDELEPEEDALSRKERRKRRKLEAAGLLKPEAETKDDKDKPASPAKGQTPAKEAHGVWIGNMNFKTTSKELIDWLAERGIGEVRRINMPAGKKAHEANRGFAYVDFASETEMKIAIGLSEQHLNGRKLLIKASTDYTGRPATSTVAAGAGAAIAMAATSEGGKTLSKTQRKILNQQKNAPAPCLFFGNLGFETTADDIKQMIESHHEAAQLWQPKSKLPKKKGERKSKKSKKDVKDDSDSDSESESDAEDEDKDDSDKSEAEDPEDKPSLPSTSTAGIRKVRIGTFEDSGKCKGWAFVDFHTSEQATAVLINTRNHTLNGRSLNVEFASADAVRRGALGTRSAVRQRKQERATNGDDEDGTERPAPRKRSVRMTDDAMAQNARQWAADATRGEEARERPTREGRQAQDRPRKDGPSRPGFRAKPGAALANAARASQAIVESKGRKTTFE